MISFWADRHNKNCLIKKNPLSLFTNLFKRKKYKVNRSDCLNRVDSGRPAGGPHTPTTLSISVMDIRMTSPCPLSPALSTLTLTPGRTRDIDQDMEALRLSRQDNPFLQVLASRESLVDSLYEAESDDANLMSQDYFNEQDVDPLSLPEIHEHMIRSPPPITWPKSPNYKVFKFPVAGVDGSVQDMDHIGSYKSPGRLLSPRQSNVAVYSVSHGARSSNGHRPHQRSSSECRQRSSHNMFVSKFPVRSLSDVRRSQYGEDRHPPSTLPLQRFA